MLPDISHGRRRLLIGEADRTEKAGHGRGLGGREKGRDGRDGRGGGDRQRGGAKTRGRGGNKKSGRGNNNKRSKPDRKPERSKPGRGGDKDKDRGKRDKIKAENAKRHERNEKMKEMREKTKKGGRGKDRSKKQQNSGRKPKQKSGRGKSKQKSGRGKNKPKKSDKDKVKKDKDSSEDRPKKNDKDKGKKDNSSSKDRPSAGRDLPDRGKKDEDSSKERPDKGKKDKDDSSKDRPHMNLGGNQPNKKPGRDEPKPTKKPGKQGSKNDDGKKPGKQGSKNDDGKKPGKNQTDGKLSFGGGNDKKPGKQGSKNDDEKKPSKQEADGKFSLGGNGKKPKSSSEDGPLQMDADAGTTWQFGGPLGFNFVSSLADASTLVEDFEGSISLKWDVGTWKESNDSYRGSKTTASGIADASLGSAPTYSKRTLTTESGFHRGVLTFMLKADSLRLPNEAFYVEVDGTVALPPSATVSTPSREWVEYSVPVGSGVHSVAFVHVHNPFGLESLPRDGAGGLWMDELRYAPFTTELSEVEMTNEGWALDGNSKAVASTADIPGNAGSADISFVLYTSHGGELSYDILSETTGPHDDFAVDLNGRPAEAVFGEMVSFDKRRLTIPPGKQTVTLRHRKNPGRLGQGVLDGLSPVGTEGRTKLQKIEFWGQAPTG
ncbi:hypothetical protein ACHAXT_013122 [Thalassiosira profunda]